TEGSAIFCKLNLNRRASQMARLHQIWVKRAHKGVMDAVDRATLLAGRGIVGNADQGGKRQVTLIELERWRELMDSLNANLETGGRGANLVVDGIARFDSRGKTLRIGSVRLRISGETRPCERMDTAASGLQSAMRERWGGGVFAEVLDDGDIAVSDDVRW